jgi:hypothetical protein
VNSNVIIRTPKNCAQAQLDAYNNRDVDAFVAVYSPNIQLIDLVSGLVFCNGQSELKERYSRFFADNPQLHCRLVSRVCCGNIVIDEEHVTGIGSSGAVHAVATYLVENGLIIKAWFVKESL